VAWSGTTVTTPAVGDEITAAQAGVIAADLNALGGAWLSYTPTVTGAVTNPGLGTGGSTAGQYLQLGKLVIVHIQIGFGTGPTAGSGAYSVSLPVATAIAQVGTANLLHSSAYYHYDAYLNGSIMQMLRGDASAKIWGSTEPAAPAAGDAMYIFASYRTT